MATDASHPSNFNLATCLQPNQHWIWETDPNIDTCPLKSALENALADHYFDTQNSIVDMF